MVNDRAERAEARLEMAEAQLEQERGAAEEYKVGGWVGGCAALCVQDDSLLWMSLPPSKPRWTDEAAISPPCPALPFFPLL